MFLLCEQSSEFQRFPFCFECKASRHSKYIAVHECLAVKNSFSTYIWSKVNLWFCEAVYGQFSKQDVELLQDVEQLKDVELLQDVELLLR